MKSLFAVLLSGAMWFASTGVNHAWPLAWFAPLPLLVILPDLRIARAAAAALIASALGSFNLVLAYRDMPPAALGLVVLFTALLFAVVALTWRAIERRAHPAVAAVAFPALVVSSEYLTSLVSPHGTFGSLAYSQADVTAVIQLASVTGLWGISFAVSLFPAALAVAWRGRGERKRRRIGFALAALSIVVPFAFGVARLAAPYSSETVKVGLAASDGSTRYFATQDPSEAVPVIRAYAGRAAALAARGARIIVLPEKFVGVTPGYGDVARAILALVAYERRVTIVAGFNLLGGPERRNVADVFGPDGAVTLEYDKVHFVPGVEGGYRAGKSIGIFKGVPAPIGVAICKDLDFVPLGRAYARAGTGLLLVPAWDFGKDGWLHSRMALMRSVEGGFALARTASNGLLTVSDARGRLLAERESAESAEVMLTAEVPVAPGGTFFSKAGDWFAWLCLGGVLVILLSLRPGAFAFLSSRSPQRRDDAKPRS